MKKLFLMGIIGIGLTFLFPSCSPYYYHDYGYRSYPPPRYYAAPPPPRYYVAPRPYGYGRHHHRRRH